MKAVTSQRKVALVCTGFPIPTETFIIGQVSWLSRMGIQADIFPYKKWPSIKGEFEELRMEESIFPAVVPPRSLFHRFKQAGKLFWKHRKHFLRLVKTLNPFLLGKSALDLTAFFSSIPFLDKPHYDLVLAHFGENGIGMQKLIGCGFLKAPLITFFYGYDIYSTAIIQNHSRSYLKVFNTSKHVVGVSKHMCDRFSLLGCSSSKIVYCPCPPNDVFFSVPLNYEGPSMLAIGRFVEKKAPHLTIKAFHILQQAEPDAGLIMVGDGPLKAMCEKLVAELELRNVFFMGTLPHAATEELFKTSFCFVQHSVTASTGDCEGTPVGILEASAAGLPVISTRHGGIPDVVVHNKTGILVDEGDFESMAAGMLKLFRNRDLCNQMGNAGRTWVFENFRGEKYREVLENLIGSGHT